MWEVCFRASERTSTLRDMDLHQTHTVTTPNFYQNQLGPDEIDCLPSTVISLVTRQVSMTELLRCSLR